LVLAGALTTALAACGDDDPVSSRRGEIEAEFASRALAMAVGHQWELVAFIDGDQIDAVVPGTSVTLHLAEGGRVTGSTGCNQYLATCELLDSMTVSFGGIGATEMACAGDGIMVQESRHLRRLGAVTTLASSDQYLDLHDGQEDAYLRFIPGGPDSTVVDTTAIDSVPVRPLGIRLGSSFGECLGYCRQEMLLDEEEAVLVARGWDEVSYPEKEYREKMDPDLWRRLLAMADFTVLDQLDEVYGCPDCADGGAEWVSMGLSGRVETVRFEYGVKLEPIAELVQALRDVRDGMVERSGF
jgi:heat shock protein HslJ